jgi:two-component sensor histidine kinase
MSRTGLTGPDRRRLELLLLDWQLLADLSFADLVLWVPLEAGGFVAAAQVRPTTGPTVHHDDVVGREVPPGRRTQVEEAYTAGRICRERDPEWSDDVPVREETIPVRRGDRVVAVVSRHTNLATARTPSRLELTYLRCADDLARMLAEGRFPVGEPAGPEPSPRVGDGLVRLDASGVVTFASPNALSTYRRLGVAADLVGRHLGEVTRSLGPVGPADPAVEDVAAGRVAHEAEVETAGGVVRLRAVPLDPGGVRVGGLVLCRDVTDLRGRERELVGKDTTIREIHHRVKNNLQTVAALLRLQSRRLADAPARDALAQAERRVRSIALVHETLSRDLDERVDFDDVADRVVALVAEVSAAGRRVRVGRSGSFGPLPPEVATPLALVLAELLQNAADHGAGPAGDADRHRPEDPEPGRDPGAAGDEVRLLVERAADLLTVTVRDDGPGPPAGFDPLTSTGLGLQIVRTLVEGELRGSLTLERAEPGLAAVVALPLPADADPGPGGGPGG